MTQLDPTTEHACFHDVTVRVGVAVDRATNEAYFFCAACRARLDPETGQ